MQDLKRIAFLYFRMLHDLCYGRLIIDLLVHAFVGYSGDYLIFDLDASHDLPVLSQACCLTWRTFVEHMKI
jgi:hypothetical protein